MPDPNQSPSPSTVAPPLAAGAPGWSQHCPRLGLAHDTASHAAYATAAHRCFAGPAPRLLTIDHQMRYCLTRFTECPIYVAAPAPAPSPRPTRASSLAPFPFRVYLRRWLWLALLLALGGGVLTEFLAGVPTPRRAMAVIVVAVSIAILAASLLVIGLAARIGRRSPEAHS